MLDARTPSFRVLTRLRRTEALRSLRRETRLTPDDLIQPIFVAEAARDAGPVPTLPGIHRVALDDVAATAREVAASGIRGVLVFGIPRAKDESGGSAHERDGVVPRAVDAIKGMSPDLAVITDVCLCQYTSHGHCGVSARAAGLDARTLEALGKTATAHAAAGADLVAPSGMFDGTVHAIRAALDSGGFTQTGILSYAVKYASTLYGPFRTAAASAPTTGDRRSHQIDPANAREALEEARADVREGADAIMVKPAGPSLDVIARLRAAMPGTVLAAYQVSGEYAMLAGAAERGWLDRRGAALESLTVIKRAGADMIVSYWAADAARWLDGRTSTAGRSAP
jgi:porphobilinogen synthase